MQVPNLLFYDDSLNCGYKSDKSKTFLYSNSPFLFVDVELGQEERKGSSFVNFEEVKAIDGMIDLCLS